MITLILHLVQTQDTLVQLHQLSLVHDYNDLPSGADARYQWLTNLVHTLVHLYHHWLTNLPSGADLR